VRAVFVEFPAFVRHRHRYLDDEAFRVLQELLMQAPELGALIQGTGGLRKLRIGNDRRGKGKRGGLRVIYFYWPTGPEFWLYTIYEKGEMDDLTSAQKADLRVLLKSALHEKRIHEGEEKKSLQ
jgi:hypothetical protein